ncbi:MAG: hypothetical protein IJ560_02815 [Alphaproteobacteria bacterium]|nr:hypothetical protein [Alphaproteobacteria bacterium]
MKRIFITVLCVSLCAGTAVAHVPLHNGTRPHYTQYTHGPRPIRVVRGAPHHSAKHPVRISHHRHNIARDVILPVAVTLAMVL